MKKIIIYISCLILVTGCTEPENAHTINTNSEALNQFVNSASYQQLNLDKVQTTEIKLGQENIFYSIHDEVAEDKPILGFIMSAIRLGGAFFVTDIPTKSIFKIDRSGNVSGPHTRVGKGPGELNTVSELFKNTKSIYIPDYNNGRLNRYSHQMETKSALNDYLMTSMDVSEEYILGVNQLSQGFVPQKPEEGLIVISSIESLKDTIKTIMPRIIPEGYQPQVYNSVKFAVNSQGQSIAFYSPLPWIFVFDEQFNHTNTLLLNYSAFDTLNTAEMKLFKPKGNKGYGGQKPINSFTLMDNGDIYLTLREEVVLLSKKNRQQYEVKNKFKFVYDFDENSSYRTWVYNKVFDSNSDTVFVHNSEYLYWFIE